MSNLSLEKEDQIAGEFCQECSLRFARNSKMRSWQVDFLFVVERYDFSGIFVDSVFCQLPCYIVFYGYLHEYLLD